MTYTKERKRSEEEKVYRRLLYARRTPEQKERDRLNSRRDYSKHAEARRQRNRDYRAKGLDKRDALADPAAYLWHVAKRRSKTRDLDFTIEKADIAIPEFCPILGIKLGSVRQGHKEKQSSPSLDRVDTTQGYVKGNIRVISYKANRMKSDMSLEDIKRLYEYSVGIL